MESAEHLVLLQKELEVYAQYLELNFIRLKEANALHNMPIFVFHQEDIKLGMPLLSKEDKGGQWNILLSTVKEFVGRKLILPEKEADFRALYQSKQRHYCLFVLSEFGAQFIFLPRIYDEKA